MKKPNYDLEKLGVSDRNFDLVDSEKSEEEVSLDSINELVEETYDNLNCVDLKQENKREKLKRLSEILPPREIDMLYMSLYLNKDQTSIGSIYKVSQGDVSYRLKRLRKRVQYILSLPELDHYEMFEDLKKVLGEELSCKMMLLLEQTSQSKVGELLDISQGKVRHRYLKALDLIKDHCYVEPKFLVYYDYLSRLKGNYNSLRSLYVQDRWKHKFYESELNKYNKNALNSGAKHHTKEFSESTKVKDGSEVDTVYRKESESLSDGYKEDIVRRANACEYGGISKLLDKEGITYNQLFVWRKKFGSQTDNNQESSTQDTILQDNDKVEEVDAINDANAEKVKRKRRNFSDEYKKEIIRRTSNCEKGGLLKILEKEGIAYSQLFVWRKKFGSQVDSNQESSVQDIQESSTQDNQEIILQDNDKAEEVDAINDTNAERLAKAKRKRRNFSDEFKKEIIRRTSNCEKGGLSKILEEEGIAYSQLFVWRKKFGSEIESIQEPNTQDNVTNEDLEVRYEVEEALNEGGVETLESLKKDVDGLKAMVKDLLINQSLILEKLNFLNKDE